MDENEDIYCVYGYSISISKLSKIKILLYKQQIKY